jgi:hypothetical protein
VAIVEGRFCSLVVLRCAKLHTIDEDKVFESFKQHNFLSVSQQSRCSCLKTMFKLCEQVNCSSRHCFFFHCQSVFFSRCSFANVVDKIFSWFDKTVLYLQERNALGLLRYCCFALCQQCVRTQLQSIRSELARQKLRSAILCKNYTMNSHRSCTLML